MNEAVVLEKAFVIHVKPYRETSLIIDFFCQNAGRVSAIARGVRKSGSKTKALLQPFNSLLVSLSGKHDLKYLQSVERIQLGLNLMGTALISGLYINELLYRALPKFDDHTTLFSKYENTLSALSKGQGAIEPALRIFEKAFLTALGYGLSLTTEAISEAPIETNAFYLFQPNHGFVKLHEKSQQHAESAFLGKSLLDFALHDFSDTMTLKSAKRLMRMAISDLLGEKKINARELAKLKGGE